MSRAIESSSYNLKVVLTGVSCEPPNQELLNGAEVALISCNLKEGPQSGLTLLRHLSKVAPCIKAVFLLDRDDRDLVVEAFRSGAVGVCERRESCELLCKCITSVHQGQVWANSQQTRYVVQALAAGMPPRVTDVRGRILLSKREEDIVALVVDGMKNREIAQMLNLSEHTVKNHLFRIFERLGISSRAELILYLLGQRAQSRTGTND
jgi:DNA-binding NarL/FixJ family response regulator